MFKFVLRLAGCGRVLERKQRIKSYIDVLKVFSHSLVDLFEITIGEQTQCPCGQRGIRGASLEGH